MKLKNILMTGIGIVGLAGRIGSPLYAQTADEKSETKQKTLEGQVEVDPADPTQRLKFLALAETRLDVLDRHIGDNDFHQRRIERLQERHRELSEEEDDPTYLRSVVKFARDLRQLEKDVYGTDEES